MTTTLTTATGALAMIGLNTRAPDVFWNGGAVPGVVGVRVNWSAGHQSVTLQVLGEDTTQLAQMRAGGVQIKRSPT